LPSRTCLRDRKFSLNFFLHGARNGFEFVVLCAIALSTCTESSFYWTQTHAKGMVRMRREGRRSRRTQVNLTLTRHSGEGVSQGLAGVRKAARENKEMKFTALLHHLTVDLPRESFYSLNRKAAPGVDGGT
jgi:hypothetical protein